MPGPVAFEYTHSAPTDVLTVQERAQSVSFVARYENLPTDYSVQLVERDGNWYIGNLPFLRHALNDFRPLIQNKDDAVYFQNVHRVWFAALRRVDAADGLTIRARDRSEQDVTDIFARWVIERNQAITAVLSALDYDYLYNGMLQHSDVRFSERFLNDYVSGELNYILWKHVHALGFIRELLVPYYSLTTVLTSPKPGAL